jgi:hypothetical protein
MIMTLNIASSLSGGIKRLVYFTNCLPHTYDIKKDDKKGNLICFFLKTPLTVKEIKKKVVLNQTNT